MTEAHAELGRRIAESRTPERWRELAEIQRRHAHACDNQAKRLRASAGYNEREAEKAREKEREYLAWAEMAENLQKTEA